MGKYLNKPYLAAFFQVHFYKLLDSSASLDAKHKAELQELLEQANLITYLDSFLDKGRSYACWNLPYWYETSCHLCYPMLWNLSEFYLS